MNSKFSNISDNNSKTQNKDCEKTIFDCIVQMEYDIILACNIFQIPKFIEIRNKNEHKNVTVYAGSNNQPRIRLLLQMMTTTTATMSIRTIPPILYSFIRSLPFEDGHLVTFLTAGVQFDLCMCPSKYSYCYRYTVVATETPPEYCVCAQSDETAAPITILE